MLRLWAIYRYKLLNNGEGPLDGLFLTPALQVARPFDGETVVLNSLLYLSYQHVCNNGVSLQYFAGAGYGVSDRPSETYKMYTGFSPSIGVSLGYTF